MTFLSHFVVALLLLLLLSPSAPSSAEADREYRGVMAAAAASASPAAFESASAWRRRRRPFAVASHPFRGGGSGAGGVDDGDGGDDCPEHRDRDDDDAGGEETPMRRRLLSDLSDHHRRRGDEDDEDEGEEDDIAFDLDPSPSGSDGSSKPAMESGGDGGGGGGGEAASRRARHFLDGLASSPTFRDEYWAKMPFLIRAGEVARLSSSSPSSGDGRDDDAVGGEAGGRAGASVRGSTSATGSSWIEGMFTLERDLRMIHDSYITGHRTADVLRNGTRTDTWAFDPLKDDATRKTTWGDVEDALSGGTVYFNSAGSLWPNLGALCRISNRAFGLPSTVNLYVSPPNLPISVPPHTDRQDVLVFQTEGRKRWRVYRPPRPRKGGVDPLNRGKSGDVLDAEKECGTPLIDTVLRPGDCMYVPAGFPHATDTAARAAAGSWADGGHIGETETFSVHLTMGLDTHVFGLTYAHLRWCALRRSGKNHNVDIGSRSDDVYWRTVGTPPLGFLGGDGWRERTRRMMTMRSDHGPDGAGGVVYEGDDEGNAGDEGSDALLDEEASLFRKSVCDELRRVMVLLEPDRWRVDGGRGGGEEEMPSDEELGEVLDYVILDHLQTLLEVQEETYRGVGDPRSEDGILNAYRGAQNVNAFMERFAKFAGANDAKDEEASRVEGVVASG